MSVSQIPRTVWLMLFDLTVGGDGTYQQLGTIQRGSKTSVGIWSRWSYYVGILCSAMQGAWGKQGLFPPSLRSLYGMSPGRFALAVGTIGLLWETSPKGPFDAVPFHGQSQRATGKQNMHIVHGLNVDGEHTNYWVAQSLVDTQGWVVESISYMIAQYQLTWGSVIGRGRIPSTFTMTGVHLALEGYP